MLSAQGPISDAVGGSDDGAPWFRQLRDCDTMRPYEYCDWKGVKCCCKAFLNAADPKVDECEWCQATNTTRGAVSGLKLINGNLPGRIESVFEVLTPLGGYGLNELGMPGNRFNGTLPSLLSLDFPSLTSLNLGSNRNMSGTIPADLANLKYLTELNLEFSNISGTIPVMCKQTGSQLTDVFFRGMRLNGSVTTSFENCSRLVALILQVGFTLLTVVGIVADTYMHPAAGPHRALPNAACSAHQQPAYAFAGTTALPMTDLWMVLLVDQCSHENLGLWAAIITPCLATTSTGSVPT